MLDLTPIHPFHYLKHIIRKQKHRLRLSTTISGRRTTHVHVTGRSAQIKCPRAELCRLSGIPYRCASIFHPAIQIPTTCRNNYRNKETKAQTAPPQPPSPAGEPQHVRVTVRPAQIECPRAELCKLPGIPYRCAFISHPAIHLHHHLPQ